MVQDADVGSVMSAYNSVNGEWCGQSHALLTDVLRDEWAYQELTVDEQLDGDFPDNAVNFKLIEITVVSVNDGSILGQGRTTASIMKVI